MVGMFKNFFSGLSGQPPSEPVSAAEPTVISINDLLPPMSVDGGVVSTNAAVSMYTGDKFLGGFGRTNLFEMDYWTIRARSGMLFRENIYAKGIIRRYVTNIITTGLELESIPEQSILGLEEDFLLDWSEETENRFKLWDSTPKLCDHKEMHTFSQIQATIKREALIDGDILIVLRHNKVTGLPRIQIVPGQSVQSPGSNINKGKNKIEHGVETDSAGRHLAYWITQKDGKSIRLPSFDKTGRRIAKMVYGTDKRHDDVRGEPLLSIILQSLKEIDRYRDSAQRKAVVNSIMAMFIKRTNTDQPKSIPFQSGAVTNDAVSVSDSTGETRTYQLSKENPGLVAQGLQDGEEPVALGGGGTDVNFGIFEDAIVSAMSWCLETPPEIMKLSFGSNYAASQAAINEFKMFLNKERKNFGNDVCSPVYEEWSISEALRGVFRAPGFLEYWRDSEKFYEYTAWLASDWNGAVKPTTDLFKLTKAYEKLEEKGWITNDLAAKELTGTKYSKNLKKQRREVSARAAVRQPEIDQENNVNQQTQNQPQQAKAMTIDESTITAIAEAVSNHMEDLRDG